MKINIVCFTGNSGLTDYSVSLCKAIGSRARLLTSNQIEPRFCKMGFDVVTVFRRSRHYPVDILKFIFFILTNRADKYIIQGVIKFPLIDGLLVRLLKLFGVHFAVTVHDVLPHYPNPLSKFIYTFYYKSFERYIVHSERSSAALKSMGLIQPELIVPHGIYDLFNLTAPSRIQARLCLGLHEPSVKVLLFFGHIESRKGIFEFVKLAKTCRDNKQLKFLIAGKSSLRPSEEKNLILLAQEAGNIEFHNQRIPFENVENYFTAADVVVLPYLEGTTSGVLKLALAFSRPVLATNVGDFKEQIADKFGLCVPMDENIIDSLKSGLLSLLRDQQRWESSCAVEIENMQWKSISRRLIKFIDET